MRVSGIIIAFLLLIGVQRTYATHNRAGEITYEFTSNAGNTIKVTITTYTRESSVQADRDSLPIHWGDGKPDEILYRTNGPLNSLGIPNGESLGNDIKKNIYIGYHTYPGAPPPPKNFFIISMTDPNRNDGIINISGSVNVPFYLEDTIFFPTNIQNLGLNHSPILLNPPIDFANVGDTFYHNPLAYDPDGDSITFQQIVSKQGQGTDVPGYFRPSRDPGFPLQYDSVDTHTGLYTWAVPQQTGEYNVAFLIREYRRGYLLSAIIRDMQILVRADTNHPPRINEILDTCIRAGDRLRINVIAHDQDRGQTVTLSALGGPFILPDSLSPATFTSTSGNPANGIFNWNTVCLDIRGQPYQVIFKARDNGNVPLVDQKLWNIQVIAPPPLNLNATVVNKKVQLNWSKYLCEDIHTFRGFSIWKKIGSNPFTPDYCETGLAGRGYTMIANKIFDTTYVDVDAVGGQQLCYRILAHFSKKSPNGLYEYDKVVSVPSNEDCIYLPYSVPVITNVSVTQTDQTAGQMYVEWTKPIAGGNNLDTVQDPPPYKFELFRSAGYTLARPVLIHTTISNSYAALNDTTYTDTNLNTADSAYSYKVRFTSLPKDTIGTTNRASSVYLSLSPSDRKLRLSWNYNVPWIQDTFQIYRRDYTTSGLFKYIATVNIASYVDTGLINDTTYCYYISAYGHYTSSFIKVPLINNSEIKCGIPIDTIAPCPPVVSITNDCGKNVISYDCTKQTDPFNYVNNLTWVNYTDSCASDVVKYRIYYAPDSGSLVLIDSTIGIDNTSYTHLLDSNVAGCYVVTALDRVGNESPKTNRVCIDNCPHYDLPNTFTPNGDTINEYFTPVCPIRFVTRVEFKVFNRWGDKIFETTDPMLKWDGKDQKTGKEVSDGVYYYSGYYFEQTLRGEERKPLPQRSGGGIIHLIRGK
jgi:gliding motility-associated-like protein